MAKLARNTSIRLYVVTSFIRRRQPFSGVAAASFSRAAGREMPTIHLECIDLCVRLRLLLFLLLLVLIPDGRAGNGDIQVANVDG